MGLSDAAKKWMAKHKAKKKDKQAHQYNVSEEVYGYTKTESITEKMNAALAKLDGKLGPWSAYESGSFNMELKDKNGKTLWKDAMGNQLVDKGDNLYISLHNNAEAQQLAGQQQLANMITGAYVPNHYVTSSVFYGSSAILTNGGAYSVGFGGSPSHGYYDAGQNNKKMVADLEAKVAELKMELDKKKLQEEALATTDGKRVVEI